MVNSKAKQSRGTAIVVLGMHRSGTSILARALQAHGCALSSQLLGANPSNPSGHWESSAAIAINDKLLADLGRSWDDLRELPPAWLQGLEAQEAKARIKILLEGDFRNEALWAIKEPRMCRLAPLWIEAITELGFDVKVVMAVRHPREVALSLLRRDSMPMAHGLMLWTQHMLDAEVATRRLRRVVVSHQEISGDWRSSMARIGKALGVKWPVSSTVAADVLDQVISVDNVNINKAISGADLDDGLVPRVCEALYESAVEAGSGAGEWSKFIAIADEFKVFSSVYDPVVSELYRNIQASQRHWAEGEARLLQLSEVVPVVAETAVRIEGRLQPINDQVPALIEMAVRIEGRLQPINDQVPALIETAARIEGRLQPINDQVPALIETAARIEGRLQPINDQVPALIETAARIEGRLQRADELVAPLVAGMTDGFGKIALQARDMQVELLSRFGRMEMLESTIARLQADLDQSFHALARADLDIEQKQAELQSSRESIAAIDADLRIARTSSLELEASASQALERKESELEAYRKWATSAENELQTVYASWSMRLTKPLRGAKALVGGLARRTGRMLRVGGHLLREPGRYLRIAADKRPGEVLSLVRGFIARGGPKPVAPEPVRFDLRAVSGPVVVLTTRHCEYIAREIRDALARVGIDSEIIFERPASGYADVPHFVICPQMFPELPGFYVAFQMEQSVSSRWFNADYMRMLESSFAIFDYSTTNITFLKDSGLSLRQIYYVPVGPLPGILPESQQSDCTDEYDVVFYGDANNERRQKYLQELSKRYRVKVVSEVFGEDLYRILSRAKLVVNIHYYAGALLETTRIWECLSLGKLVVSERSSDMDEHGELEGIVDFVEIDDIQALIDRVGHWLEMDSERERRIQEIRQALASGLNRFDYFFFRFLLATDNISFEEFWREAGSKFELKSDRLCLNLPEYTDRSKDFAKDNKYGFSVLPGLRHSKGWVGCAMSYKYMIMLARENDLGRITICEDDVEFPADFEQAMVGIDTYLAGHKTGWDIFSGLMADLHKDAKILAIDDHEGRTFATTNRLISTVMNVYNRTVFDLIAGWNENDRNVETNTIDRYLERNSQLKVVVTEPFLVGHKEEQHSTIWGFQNTQYAEMIAKSSALLRRKIDAFRR